VKVDFAKNAESYGCRAWRVNDEQSLLTALASRAHPGPTLLDISAAETMTHDYASWWRTGDAQVAESLCGHAAEQTQRC
jgi:3D-(3,5/4)-trihydroxycyclohexane-1,2-dione acylhydrolase (decyclizing)